MQETGKGVNELATTCVPASCLVHSRASHTHTYACRRLQVKRMGLVGEHTVVAAAARRSESAKPYADMRAVLPPYMSPSLPT